MARRPSLPGLLSGLRSRPQRLASDQIYRSGAGGFGGRAGGNVGAVTNQDEYGLRTIRGIIDTSGSGSIVAGLGFTIARNGVGDVTITFTTPFSAIPAVIPMAYGAPDRSAQLDNTTPLSGSVARVRRQVGSSGVAGDGIFHFIAIGPA